MTEQPVFPPQAQAPAPAPAKTPDPQQQAALDEQCKTALGFIDTFLRGVGIKDPATLTDEQGWRYIQLGSAEGRAGVSREDDNAFLQAEARVMQMPSDKDLILALMRQLLELNLTFVGPVRLGIREDIVFAALQYPVDSLTEDLVGRCIHSVMTLADGIDDMLGKKYGGTSLPRQAQP
jgi:hypothetical protein